MSSTSQASTSPLKILIVEGSQTQAERLRKILEQDGFEVDVASDGQQAWEMVVRLKPALIICDVNIPVVDGYELSSRIKGDPDFSGIPVILVTTMSHPQDIIRGLQSGADNFVLKPYEERYLVSRVRYELANRAMRRSDDAGPGVDFYLEDQSHFITADRQQILKLLISTCDAVQQRNEELSLNQGLLEKRSTEVALANRFLDSVIENIPDMIFVKDAVDLRYVRFNRAGEELVGYSQADLVGKNDHDFFPRDEAEFFISKDREVLARGEMADISEEPIHTRHNGIRILHTKKIPIVDDAGVVRLPAGHFQRCDGPKRKRTRNSEVKRSGGRTRLGR